MFKSLIGFFLISLVLLSSFGVTNVQVVANNQLEPFISEINFRGSLSTTRCIKADKINDYKPNTNWCGKDQWLEIHNPGSNELRLDNYTLELRNQKTINLSGYTIPANGYFVINFTQSNFDSIINNPNLSSYQMLYISSESDADTAKHNVTAILKSANTIIDSINLHPNKIDPDYLNARGKSYFRCNKDSNWQITTTKYGIEDNYATPKKADPKCPKTQAAAIPVTPPVVNKISSNPAPKINGSKTVEPATKVATKTQPIKVASTQVVAIIEVAPKFELKNISSINLAAVSLQNLEPKNTVNLGLSGDQSINFEVVQLPADNLKIAYKYQLNNLFSYYYQENLSILNILLLTGLVFRLIKSVDTKLFYLLQYVTRTKKRWQPNF